MELYLFRHGIAENGRPGLKDADRALTAEGKDKLKRVLVRARGAGVEPGVILSSPYRRALETAQIAAESLGYRGKIVQTPALTPDASPHQVWEEIRARRTERSILLASHEPLMSAAVAFLLGSPAIAVEMKKAGLARIDCDQFGPEPKAVLKWLLTPAIAKD
ncbi:MAG: phosphohistidine phosphatase SixA [Acidobacteriia bacterium]|nr:phosphohistidine phosphatase SixA [Terriglobia bacterium]